MPSHQELSDSEYLDFEESIAESARGRAFLREHSRRSSLIGTDSVKKLIYRLRDSWEGGRGKDKDESARINHKVGLELKEMSEAIEHTKREIASLQPKDPSKNRIVTATEELDAVVSATEQATSEILQAAENLNSLAEKYRNDGMAEVADAIEGQVIEIMMACSFQDITGQRTTKVVKVLKYVEQKVNSMVSVWGISDHPPEPEPTGDERLLNGPQLPGRGIDQSAVDAMLAPTPKAPVAEEPEMDDWGMDETPKAAMGQDDIDAMFK